MKAIESIWTSKEKLINNAPAITLIWNKDFKEKMTSNDQSFKLDMNKVRAAIVMDPHIEDEHRNALTDLINDPDIFSLAVGGYEGGSIGAVASKFLNMDNTSQMLLSLAGVGLGIMLVKHLGQDQSNLVSYSNGKYTVHQK